LNIAVAAARQKRGRSKKTLASGGAKIKCCVAAVRRKRAGAREKGRGEKSKRIDLMNSPIILAIAAALAIGGSPALAQTLTQPNPAAATKTSPPNGTTKSRHTGHVKTCDAYGAGFRNIPGTDACIKIGGGVTVDVGR
jgi:hypothetical protein